MIIYTQWWCAGGNSDNNKDNYDNNENNDSDDNDDNNDNNENDDSQFYSRSGLQISITWPLSHLPASHFTNMSTVS